MGKVFSIFRRRKEAGLDVAEAQLRDLNAVVTREETRRNSLVASRRGAMSKLFWWGMPLVLLAITWAVASVYYEWISFDGGYVHLLPALIGPLLLTFGSCYDFRIRRANYRIGKLQTQKAKVVDDLENSDEFKKFMEQKKKWDQLAQLKRDPVGTPAKTPAPTPLSSSMRTPVRPQAPPRQPPATPLSASVPSVSVSTPAVTPAKPISIDKPEAPLAHQQPPAPAPATPAPTPAPTPATPKAYYRPVTRNPNQSRPAPSTPADKKQSGMLAWLASTFIGDEEDDRYTAVPLMCQYCGAQNGLRENTHFKTAYYEFTCRSCRKVNQLRSAESLSDILAFTGSNEAPAKETPPPSAATHEPSAEPEPKTPQAKKDE